jgi:hypothetical protein
MAKNLWIETISLISQLKQSLMSTSTNFSAFNADPDKKRQCLQELSNTLDGLQLVEAGDLAIDLFDQYNPEHPEFQHYENNSEDLGIPIWFLVLTEHLFTKLPNGDNLPWASLLIEGISLGAGLNEAWRPFAAAMLRSGTYNLKQLLDTAEEKDLIDYIHCLHTLKNTDRSDFEAAVSRVAPLVQTARRRARRALLAMSDLCQASYFSFFTQPASQFRFAKAAVSASIEAAEARMLGPNAQIIFREEAYQDQADLLLKVVSGMDPFEG